jgi:hypothetical protein
VSRPLTAIGAGNGSFQLLLLTSTDGRTSGIITHLRIREAWLLGLGSQALACDPLRPFSILNAIRVLDYGHDIIVPKFLGHKTRSA